MIAVICLKFHSVMHHRQFHKMTFPDLELIYKLIYHIPHTGHIQRHRNSGVQNKEDPPKKGLIYYFHVFFKPKGLQLN